MILEGYVKGKTAAPIEGANIELKGKDFITLYSTTSDENGYYRFDVPSGRYPFLTAVKDYAVNCLEYWCQNIDLQNDMSIDISFDKLEIYGAHAFSVHEGIMLYFRPMSLRKFQSGEKDIAPSEISICVKLDGEDAELMTQSKVKELGDGLEMTAYLIQVKAKNALPHRIDIEITDENGDYGAATVFCDAV